MKLKELPRDERPREKMMFKGKESLTNIELLAILIRTGTRNKTAIRIAEELLGMNPDGLSYICQCSIEELSKIDGMGLAKSCQVMAALELGKRIASAPRKMRKKIKSTQDVADLFMERLRYNKREHFEILLLNTQGEIIAVNNVSIGDLSSSIVNPREAFAIAIKRSASAVIFIHNHPSGNPTPSGEDVKVTKRLFEAGEILGIQVLDHIIVGDGVYVSFKEKGLI